MHPLPVAKREHRGHRAQPKRARRMQLRRARRRGRARGPAPFRRRGRLSRPGQPELHFPCAQGRLRQGQANPGFVRSHAYAGNGCAGQRPERPHHRREEVQRARLLPFARGHAGKLPPRHHHGRCGCLGAFALPQRQPAEAGGEGREVGALTRGEPGRVFAGAFLRHGARRDCPGVWPGVRPVSRRAGT